MSRSVGAEAFLAVLDGDETACRQLLSGLFPHELDELRAALGQMRSITSETYRDSRQISHLFKDF
jgi:hypothetical protein